MNCGGVRVWLGCQFYIESSSEVVVGNYNSVNYPMKGDMDE